jgi:hypothetical protein
MGSKLDQSSVSFADELVCGGNDLDASHIMTWCSHSYRLGNLRQQRGKWSYSLKRILKLALTRVGKKTTAVTSGTRRRRLESWNLRFFYLLFLVRSMEEWRCICTLSICVPITGWRNTPVRGKQSNWCFCVVAKCPGGIRLFIQFILQSRRCSFFYCGKTVGCVLVTSRSRGRSYLNNLCTRSVALMRFSWKTAERRSACIFIPEFCKINNVEQLII